MLTTRSIWTKVKCACGAIGHAIPPYHEFEPADVPTSLFEWRGGNVAKGRVAVELLPGGITACPACQHRACAYVRATGGR